MGLLDQGGQADAHPHELAQDGSPHGVAPRQLVEHKHPGVARPGGHRQHVAHKAAAAQAVQKEAEHAAEDQQAGPHVQPVGFLPKDQPHEENHEHRRGELQKHRIARSGKLGGDRVQGGSPAHPQGPDEHAGGELAPVMGGLGKDQQDPDGDDASEGVDGQRLPGNHFHAQPANAQQQGGGEDQQQTLLGSG